jgi:Tfp pilus assembly protein PilX
VRRLSSRDTSGSAPRSKQGYVLVTSLIISLAVGIVAVGLLKLTLQEYRLAMRSAAYTRALHAAESGAELAADEFVRQIQGGSAWSGWSTSGFTRTLQNTLTNAAGDTLSSYSVAAVSSGAGICTVTSTGTVSLAGQTIERAIRITLLENTDESSFFKYGILSKAAIHLGGSVKADSYDSTDPTKSTNGQYDPSKATQNATLATLSSDDPAIEVSGGAQLNGISSFSVGEGGTVRIPNWWWPPYSGIITYDAAQEIEDVEVPISQTPNGSIDTGPWKQRFQTLTVNGTQDMSLESIKVVSDGRLTITGSGKLRVYVDEKMTVSGSGRISIVPNPSSADLKVEFYVNDKVSIAGSGLLNNTHLAANCSIWATENCSEVKVTGNSGFIGTIYAPYSDVDLTGSSFASGAFLGGSVKFTGNTRFYIDESLIGAPSSSPVEFSKPYTLTEWIEL